MRVTVAALFVLAGLAGCAEGPGAAVETIEVPDPLAFEQIVQDRPVLASITVHETPEKGATELEFLGAERWEPRDAQLTYHGLGEVHNEWGRLVPAHVFRYNPMVFTIKSIEIDVVTGTVDIDGEYQERQWEMYFDAADGRAMGLTDLERGVRSFSDPAFRLPYGPGYIGDMLLSMVAYMHGDITAPVALDWGGSNTTFWMERYHGQRPLTGDCDMYIHRSKTERPDAPAMPSKPNPDPYRSIACFDDAMIPLWHWSGNKTNGHLALERRGPGFAWPGPTGDVLPPDPFDTGPMEAIDPILPLSDPIYTPPADTGEDWATGVRERVAALHRSVPYREFEAAHGPSYAQHVITGWPAHAFPAFPLLEDLTDVARFKETTWVMVADGEDWFWTNVHTLDVGEGGRMFVPDQNGNTFRSGPSYPTREGLGDVVKTTSVRGRVPEFSPQDPRMINWLVWPEFGSDWAPTAWWTIASHCFEETDKAQFLMFDGKDGHLMGAGGMESRSNGCSMGTFTGWVGGQEVTIIPATVQRPFPIVLDAAGGLALPLPPSAMHWDGVRIAV